MITRFAFLFLFFFSSLAAQGISSYETLFVEKINIVVTSCQTEGSVAKETLLTRMKTEEGKLFSISDFDEDLKTLSADFEDIDPVIEVCEGRLTITLKVALKPTIRSINWCGNWALSPEKLQKELNIPVGSAFDRTAFNKAFFEVKKLYVNRGFFSSELNYEIEHDRQTNEVDISIQIVEGTFGKIHHVHFVNFTDEERAALEEIMVSKPWNYFFCLLSGQGVYSEDHLLRDQYAITNFMQNRGYADAKIAIEAVDIGIVDRFDLVVTLDRGDYYSFGDVTIEGNCLFSCEEILAQIPIKSGCSFSPEEIHASIEAIKNLYGAKGYIDTLVEFDPTLDPRDPIYHIHILVEEGEQYRVGLIKVIGNWSTQPRVILHECLLTPGELFDLRRLKGTETRLRNIGYFDCVNVYAVRAEEDSCPGDNYRDVVIEVNETTTGNFSAFAGASSLENVFGGLSVAEKNFNAAGLFDIWREGPSALRGGGEYAFMNFVVGAKSRKYNFSWAKPFFRDTPWVIGFDVDSSMVNYVSNNYTLRSWGTKFWARYPLHAYLTGGWHWRVRNSWADGITTGGQLPNDLQVAIDAKGLASGVGLFLLWDSTDHPLLPCCGLRYKTQSELVGVGGDLNFVSFSSLFSYYYPLTAKGVFKTRFDMQFIVPYAGQKFDKLPLEERIFIGGINSVRGFKDFSLGPKFEKSKTDKAEDPNDPKGGISMQLFSLEYTYRYSRTFEPFVFYDMGALSDSSMSWGPFQASTGIGLRAYVLAGSPPLILGYGWPVIVSPEDEGDFKRFFFSMGGNF